MKYEDEILNFEMPAIAHKHDAIAFIHEMVSVCENLNGTGGLDEAETYEGWLEDCKRINSMAFDGYESKSWVPAVTFFAVRKTDNKIVGMVNIRKNLSRILDEKQAGNIGYSTRPGERRKGYAKRIMKFAMDYCREVLGLKIVRAGCNELNIGSKKTIESANLKLIARRKAIISHLYYEWKE